MAMLGPVSSTEVSSERGSRDLYVSLSNVLDANETVTGTPTVTCSDDTVTVSDVAANTVAIVDGDTTVPIGEAIEFRVTTTADLEGLVTLDVHWETNQSNYDTATVKLRIRETLE